MHTATIPKSSRPSAVNPWLVLCITSLGVILVMINLGALNVALPAIARHFHTTATLANWVLLSFMLVNTVLILVFAQFSDSYGRKRLYLLGMFIFTLASLIIGWMPNIWWFLAVRVLQAAGGALIIANNTALITDAFPEEKLGTGLGLNVLVSSAAQLAGPVIGGVIASQFGWQWVFWSGVPVGILGLGLGIIILRKFRSAGSGRPIDGVGGFLTFVAIGGLVLALSEASTLGWGHPVVLAGLAMFVIAAPLLCWLEPRRASPMFDFTLFRHRTYAMANLAAFLNAFARVSVVLLSSLYLQSVVGTSAFDAGLAVLPVTLGVLVASPMAGALTGRWSARVLSTTGLGISAAGLVILLAALQPKPVYVWDALGMLLVGFGSGLFLTPNTRSIMTGVPYDRRGFANGLRSMLQNMGQVLSTAISLTLVTAVLPARLQDVVYQGTAKPLALPDVEQITNGYRLAYLVLLAATMAGIAVSALRESLSAKPSEHA
ncbi:MFS transporter [Alicyclobacillus contaminans]|uniref:MFS transporter n=1 Tax=Alicyclobacillus contaminans TaxID=392016 RepID=UPI0006846AE3|nr:MFS transporter [Alicyclobacillus contaminans]GMA51212.1 MFS transporter [Alicyclobacillus contaminans]